MTDPAPHREEVLAALERLLAWSEISRSPQLGRFLDYIVRQTLAGQQQSIKAYSIAVDVFGRGADFDPQTDPIVRVQARRLRGLLDDYYQGPGVGEDVQIHLPVGRYVPEFKLPPDAVEVAAETIVPARRRWPPSLTASWLGLAFIGLVLAVAAYGWNSWRSGAEPVSTIQRPTITVVEFQGLSNGGDSAAQVAGLAIELVTDLEQFGTIGVRYGGGGEANIAVYDLPSSDYVLTGIVRPDGDVVQYSAILTDNHSGAVVWNHTLAVPLQQATSQDVLDRVSQSLSLLLGSPRGPLHVAARQFLASSSLTSSQVTPYLCRVLFDLYREIGSPEAATRAGACYADLPEVDQGSAMVLAARAALLAEQPDAGESIETTIDRLRHAASNLDQAIGLDPVSGFVWEQQGRLHEVTGALALARADFSSAVQLNPASDDALAAYARLLAFSGKLDGAERLAREAADDAPNPPSWYQGVPALLALRDGDTAKAIVCAELYAEADRELGPILAIMAGQRAHDSAVVNRYLPQVLDIAAFRAMGVLPRLRERISDSGLIEAIRAALVQAGVPPAALVHTF